MSEFNKIYVNFVRDESLHGKYGYFSDNIDSLEMYVTENNHRCYGKLAEQYTTKSAFPFMREDDGEFYRFFYHDPKWNSETPHSRWATNYELSRWLSHGHGEVCLRNNEGLYSKFCGVFRHCPNILRSSYISTEFSYCIDDADKQVCNVLVRGWGDTEWRAPTIDYLRLADRWYS